MRFVFVSSPDAGVNMKQEHNRDYDRDQVLAALARLREQGHPVEEVNARACRRSDSRPSNARYRLPLRVRLRTIGRAGSSPSRSSAPTSTPWQAFGAETPALVVYDHGLCSDVYPHEQDQRPVTIIEYLTSFQ
jgi:hypothetical protein